MRKNVNRRSSIITIIICIVFIALVALCVIKLSEKIKENEGKEDELYFSNLDEEDKMQYEYKKIDTDLDGIYAFGIVKDYVVGIKGVNNYVNIFKIDSNNEYDYCYYDTKLYLLEKSSGTITAIDLTDLLRVEETATFINLEKNVNSFQVVEGDIYYLSDNKIIRYNNGENIVIFDNVTSNNFLVKNDELYSIVNEELISKNIKNDEIKQYSSSVKELYYYNYNERDRLVYDVCLDGQNSFKNIYNFNTKAHSQSVKNDTFFIPYGEKEYLYTTENNMNLVLISSVGMNKYLYKSEKEIDELNFFKEGYITLKIGEKIKVIEIESEEEVDVDNISFIDNIKYIKY